MLLGIENQVVATTPLTRTHVYGGDWAHSFDGDERTANPYSPMRWHLTTRLARAPQACQPLLALL